VELISVFNQNRANNDQEAANKNETGRYHENKGTEGNTEQATTGSFMECATQAVLVFQDGCHG